MGEHLAAAGEQRGHFPACSVCVGVDIGVQSANRRGGGPFAQISKRGGHFLVRKPSLRLCSPIRCSRHYIHTLGEESSPSLPSRGNQQKKKKKKEEDKVLLLVSSCLCCFVEETAS